MRYPSQLKYLIFMIVFLMPVLSVPVVYAQDDVLPVIGRPWMFARSDGSLIASPIYLHLDGTIGGYWNENEAYWGLEDNGQTVVFYTQRGKPSTRFTRHQIKNGLYVLSGRFLLDPSINVTHVLSEQSWTPVDSPLLPLIMSRPWEFGRFDGSVIASPIYLEADGTISGYWHENEAYWGVDGSGQMVVFYTIEGEPSTRFEIVDFYQDLMVMSGPFLLDAALGVTHSLREIPVENLLRIIDMSSGSALPEGVVVAGEFFDWYIEYMQRLMDGSGSPVARGWYRSSDYFTQDFVDKLDDPANQDGGYDRFICAQDVPEKLSFYDIEERRNEVVFTATSDMVNHTFEVHVKKIGSTWKIDDIVCFP